MAIDLDALAKEQCLASIPSGPVCSERTSVPCGPCVARALASRVKALDLIAHAVLIEYRRWNGPGIYVECSVCFKRKGPRGRSVAVAMAGTLCDTDCRGYDKAPRPTDIWPGETREDFGYGWPDWLTAEVRAALRSLEGL